MWQYYGKMAKVRLQYFKLKVIFWVPIHGGGHQISTLAHLTTGILHA